MDTKLKDYVDSKIIKYTFYARDFTKTDIDFVNTFCKEFYNDDRKLMILDLIRYKADNMALNILNEKIDFIYNDLLNRIDNKEHIEDKKPNVFKGFSQEK